MVYKIILLGNSTVGKTSLINRLVNNIFEDAYIPTMDETYNKVIKINDKKKKFIIYDVSGSDHFTYIKDMYINESDGFIMVFSITDIYSFKYLLDLYDYIIQVKETNDVPCILIGNKSDLEFGRNVGFDEGSRLAEIWNCDYIETSAKEHTNIDIVVISLLTAIKKYKPKKCTIL